MQNEIALVQQNNQAFVSSFILADFLKIKHSQLLRTLRTLLKRVNLKHFHIIPIEPNKPISRGRPSFGFLIPQDFAKIIINRHATVDRVSTADEFYIIEFDNGIKIGCCNIFSRRLRQYQQPFCRPILKHLCIKTQNAFALEHIVKHRFSSDSHLINREFFYHVDFQIIHDFAFEQSEKLQNKDCDKKQKERKVK